MKHFLFLSFYTDLMTFSDPNAQDKKDFLEGECDVGEEEDLKRSFIL